MAKAFSLNDEVPEVIKIRRDQFKKISGIVEVNSKFPTVALGLVRDYCKNIESVVAVNFGVRENGEPYGDKAKDPKEIVVYTKYFGKSSCDKMGTCYRFKITPSQRIVPPTL